MRDETSRECGDLRQHCDRRAQTTFDSFPSSDELCNKNSLFFSFLTDSGYRVGRGIGGTANPVPLSQRPAGASFPQRVDF
jgi:hypothetical protein